MLECMSAAFRGTEPHWSWNALAIVFLPLDKGCNHATYNRVIESRLKFLKLQS